METEVDLRRYIHVVLNQWKPILGLTLLLGLLAGGVSFFASRIYRATALISVAQPPYTLQLEGVRQGRPLTPEDYTELALSDDVISGLYNQIKVDLPPDNNDMSNLRGALDVSTVPDSGLLRLTAEDRDPERAAQLSNLWAKSFADQVGLLFGETASNLSDYKSQLASVKVDLDAAEAALAAFQASNEFGIYQAQLVSKQAVLTDYLNRQHWFNLLTQDATDLQNRLALLDASASPNPTDGVALLMLVAQASSGTNLSAAGAQGSSSASPLQLQIDSSQSLAGQTVGEQQILLANIISNLQARSTDAGAQASALEPEILSLQGQVAEANVRQSALTRARDIIDQQFRTLSTKVEQAEIAAQDSANVVRIASAAGVPRRPISPRPALNVLLGATLGFVLGILLALGRAWWRNVASNQVLAQALPSTPSVAHPAGPAQPSASLGQPQEFDRA